jgi:hypothetical protein
MGGGGVGKGHSSCSVLGGITAAAGAGGAEWGVVHPLQQQCGIFGSGQVEGGVGWGDAGCSVCVGGHRVGAWQQLNIQRGGCWV